MWDTYVTIQRPEGTVVAQHIPVYVEQSSVAAVLEHNRAFGTDFRLLFSVITHAWNPTTLIQQDDVLIDEYIADPDTGAAYRYQITGRPKNAIASHQEMKAIIVVGG